MPATSRVRTTKGRGRLFDSVLDTVGDTPCIRINNIAPAGVAAGDRYPPEMMARLGRLVHRVATDDLDYTEETAASGGSAREVARVTLLCLSSMKKRA